MQFVTVIMVFFLGCLWLWAYCLILILLAEIGNWRNFPTGTTRFCSSWLPWPGSLQAFLSAWVWGLQWSISPTWIGPGFRFRQCCPALPARRQPALPHCLQPWLLLGPDCLLLCTQFLLFQRSDFEWPLVPLSRPAICSFQSLAVLRGRESTKYSKCRGSHCWKHKLVKYL